MLASDIKESENNSGQEIRTAGSGGLDATSVKVCGSDVLM